MQHIVLIGMAGAGKSTVGYSLANRLGWVFIDTDVWLAEQAGMALQEILDLRGVDGYKAEEERAILTLPLSRPTVVATGGSVIYSPRAVAFLKAAGSLVYLRASFGVIMARVNNWGNRGFVAGDGLTLQQIYQEREPLYQAAAHNVVDVDYQGVDEVVEHIVSCVTF